MATAGKEAKLVGSLSGGGGGGGGKEREHSEYSHILADVINYCGNTVILLEVVLLAFLAIKLMVHIEGWLGVAMVASLAPASITILLLTRVLKNELLEKYTNSNMVGNIDAEATEKLVESGNDQLH